MKHKLAKDLKDALWPASGATAFPFVNIGVATSGKRLFAYGTTVPTDATAGYSAGCIFFKTDGSGNTVLYVNTGTATSCTFKRIDQVAGVSGLDATGRITTTDGVTSGTARIVGGAASILSAAGTALTGSNTETVLASATLPANTIKLGTIVRVRYQGIVSNQTGATTLSIKFRMGTTTLTGTAIVSGTAAQPSASNAIFSGFIDIVGRAAPSAASACVAHALFCEATVAGAVTPKQAIMASTNFATNGALLLELTGVWSASDANSCRADIMNVEVIG